jgi:two-component system cell cycle sensor histidine kinase/response regulator CckA
MATVLVVDDVTTNRAVMSTLLSCRGHEVLEACDGLAALNVVRERHPDIVVSDVLMPGIDGLELVHRLRIDTDPLAARAPVIFYTANYLEPETRPFADTYGVSRVVLRSADPRELLDAVEEVLAVGPVDVIPGPAIDFDRAHSAAVSAKLVAKVRELRRNERQFEAMAAASPVGIALLDPHGEVVYANPRLTEITGSSAAGSWLTYPGPERYRAHLTRGDGEPRWLRVHLRSFQESESGLSGAVVMVDDISDVVAAEDRATREIRRRQAEEAAHDADRMDSLRRMAGGVAEDFDDLVGAMMGVLGMLRSSITEERDSGRLAPVTAAGLLDDLGMVARGGQRAAALTEQLRAFGRWESDEPSMVDVTGYISAFARDAATDGIVIDLRLAGDTPMVSIDRRGLDRLLQVLFRNACEAMPDGGRVRISSAAGPGNSLRVEMADTGPGMTAEVRRRAFEPFFTTKQGSRTAGLGLATAQGIVNQAGGRISLGARDGGTVVEISLPAAG